MVNALLAAVFLLTAFVVGTALFARGRAGLQLASRIMAWVTLGVMILLPIAIFAAFVAPDWAAPLNIQIQHFGAKYLREIVPLNDRLYAFVAACIPLAVTLWGLWSLRQVFERFASNEIFSTHTSVALSRLSIALVAAVFVGALAEAPITYFLTRATTQGFMAISVGNQDLTALFTAAVAAVIARVLAEATNVADENAKFV